MSEASSFAQFAARLCGQCVVLLGWKPDEFWSATPDEIASIREAMRGPEADASVSRTEIQRMMENDNGR